MPSVEQEWPDSHPLPLPAWDSPKEALKVPSLEMFQEFTARVELTLQQLLQKHNYNTVHNLLSFYEAYQTSGSTDLAVFYRRYSPPITSAHYNCVGLALELLANLQEDFYLVSCEEEIKDLDDYMRRKKPYAAKTVMEHVLVALRVQIADRPGFLLLDPAYHISRVVTVMADRCYPHTGWFLQSDDPRCRQEFHYSLSGDSKHIVWTELETREGRDETFLGVLYVDRPFLAAVHVTERRNLVYNKRSLLARNSQGQLLAGFYFKIVDCGEVFDEVSGPNFKMFYQNDGSQRVELPFSRFLTSGAAREDVRLCAQQMGYMPGALEAILGSLARLLYDTGFRNQLLRINDDIKAIASAS